MNNETTPESRARQIRFAPFALTLLCFLLPFVEVSCQGQKIDEFTGLELVTGKNVEKRDSFSGQTQTQHLDGEPLVMAAFGCALAATFFCFVSGATGKALPALGGIAGIALLLAEKARFESQLTQQSNGLGVCTWGIGFMLTCGLLLVGAIVAGLQFFQASQPKPKEPVAETG